MTSFMNIAEEKRWYQIVETTIRSSGKKFAFQGIRGNQPHALAKFAMETADAVIEGKRKRWK